MKRMIFVVLALTMFRAVAVHAADVYVVQGSATGPALNRFESIVWAGAASFFNHGIVDARVKLLGISNRGGGEAAPGAVFTLPPQRSASLNRIAAGWRAYSASPLWVLHLDVPPEVDVESLLFIGSCCLPNPNYRLGRFGKVRLPVFTSLIPAQQSQVHLGTYLGEMPSRINVAVYNAASATASARIEIRQGCDDTVVEERVVAVPAETLMQFTGFSAREGQCPPYVGGTPGGIPGDVYTVVTVDQPSFTFVSNLSNSELPLTSMTISSANR